MLPLEEQINRNRYRIYFLKTLLFSVFMGLGCLVGMVSLGNMMPNFHAGLIGGSIMSLIYFVIVAVVYLRGENIIAKLVKAKAVTREEEPYLYDILEAVSIGAGLPAPSGYIIEEESPNAFAMGRKPDKAAVGLTRGLLNKLDRNEIEMVVAHEIAHIRNQDALLAMFTVIMVGTIVMLGNILQELPLYFTGRGSRSSVGVAFILVLLAIAGLIAKTFAVLIKYAISREREYLADALAVEVGGNPDALISALKKVSGEQVDAGVNRKEGVKLLFFMDPCMFSRKKSGWFATHPSVKERIDRIRGM